jgi:hypothetical protein
MRKRNGATTFSIMTLSIITLSIMTFSIAILNHDNQHNGTQNH